MHAALKRIIVPQLKTRGFKGTYPTFRRVGPTHTDILNFQFDKNYADLFVINITQAPGSVTYTNKWGGQFRMDKVKYFEVTEPHFRLQPKWSGLSNDWFNYSQENYDDVARSVLPHIERAERWFTDTSDTDGLYPPVIRKPGDAIAPDISERNQGEYERVIARLAAVVEDYLGSNPTSELRIDKVSPFCAKIYRKVFICALEVAYIVLPAGRSITPGIRMTTATKCLEFTISQRDDKFYWFTTDLVGEQRRMNNVALASFVFAECIQF
jgi:hypothetical protein